MTAAVCRTCGTPIEWATLLRSAKTVSLDVGEHANGYLEVVERDDGLLPIVRVVPVDEREGRRLRRTHACRR